MKVYTKINGKLALWEANNLDYLEAIKVVRNELGIGHKSVILCLVKF